METSKSELHISASYLTKTKKAQSHRTMDKESVRPFKQRKSTDAAIDWESYYNSDEIYAWLDEIQQEFPEWVSVETVGQTYEGRAIKLVKLSKQEVLEIT